MNLVGFIESKTGVASFSQKHFVTSEFDTDSKNSRSSMYTALQMNSFSVDIRDFKTKSVSCTICESKNNVPVQRGVDIAIVMKAMKALMEDQLDILVLITGDCDYRDLIEYLTETKYKKVYVFGYKDTISKELYEKASSVVYLDEAWKHLSFG